MTDAENPGFIRIQIDLSYDARPHGYFAKAPDGWAAMTPEQQQKFLNDAAQQYLEEQVDCHGTYYATADDAHAENNGSWSLWFSEDNVEEAP